MTYELPADSYDGRVELQTLARRIARACVHFLQVSMRLSLPPPILPRSRRAVPCPWTTPLTSAPPLLQTNMIPISWDRVILYHLEEISPGTWQPVLSTS